MQKLQKILEFAMRMEQDAENFYNYYLDRVDSPSTKELFKELADTEKQHYSILKQKFEELSFHEPPITISWVVDDRFAARDPHILANNADTAENGTDAISDLSAIRMAYLIENDFAEFYSHAVQAIEDEEAKKFLQTLADWEVKHKELFYRKYRELLKKHWGEVLPVIFAE